MEIFHNKQQPDKETNLSLLNFYASPLYLKMFAVIGLILLYSISQGYDIMKFMLVATLTMVALLYPLSVVAMKNKVLSIHIDGEFVAVQTAYDLYKNQEPVFEHTNRISPSINGSRITLHHRQVVHILKRNDWEEFDRIWRLVNVPYRVS